METKTAIASLATLAQQTRLMIFRLLVQAGPSGMSVGDIGAAVKAAPATLSFHLRDMTHAGLILARQDGRYIFYSANYARMSELVAYLTENCCAQDGIDCEPAFKTGCAPKSSERPAKATPANASRTRKRGASAG